MNKKGFTLVELVATIFVISLVFSIAGYGAIGVINNSKKKSEEIFAGKISVAIDEYIGLYGSKFVKKSEVPYLEELFKCATSHCSQDNMRSVPVYELYNTEFGVNGFKLGVLVKENLFDNNKLINPANKLDCLSDGKDPVIRVFRDDDYVYYYYVDLSGDNTSCEISSDNGIVSTLHDDIMSKVMEE